MAALGFKPKARALLPEPAGLEAWRELRARERKSGWGALPAQELPGGEVCRAGACPPASSASAVNKTPSLPVASCGFMQIRRLYLAVI